MLDKQRDRKLEIGFYVWMGMIVLNVDALVIYAEIRHDNLVSAVALILVIPVVMGFIGAGIASSANKHNELEEVGDGKP